MKLDDFSVYVLVFGMPGCPACDAHVPVFRKVAAVYGTCVPSAAVDSNQYPDAADRFKITATPTTLVLRKGRVSKRVEGAMSEGAIKLLFASAMRGQECQIP